MKRDAEEEQLISRKPNCWEIILFNTKVQVLIVLFICLLIGIGTPFIWQQIWKKGTNCCTIESDLRYDCHPQRPLTHKTIEACKAKIDCCWDNDASEDEIQCYYGIVPKGAPKLPGYKIVSSINNVSAVLTYDVLPNYVNISNTNTSNGPIVTQNLALSVEHYSEAHFRITFRPLEDKSETVDVFQREYNNLKVNNSVISDALVYWPSKTDESFTLNVIRRQTKQIIFNTGDYSPFVYTNEFMEITTLLPNDLIFGLGQSPSRSFKHNFTYPQDWEIFNKYQFNMTLNQTSWFGSHPFWMGLDGDGSAYGILLLNSYPIEIITNSRPSLTIRTVGGNLDFHFFMGPKPSDVYKQLTALVRKPALPPYWALGFHMCRTVCDPEIAVPILQNMRVNGTPFESDCGSAALSPILFDSNTDYTKIRNFLMNNFKKYDTRTLVVQVPQKQAYSDTPKTPNATPENSTPENWRVNVAKRWKDYALKRSNSTARYEGLFYEWCGDESEITNRSVIYPSFMTDKETDECQGVCRQLSQDFEFFDDQINGNLNIDGLLLDYNTPLDLSYTKTYDMSKTCQTLLEKKKWNKYYYSKLNQNSPCLDTVYPNEHNPSHLALHNLYGYQHMKMSAKALRYREQKFSRRGDEERKLILSLSTFTGSGHIGGHIGTHMNASWDMLRQTLVQTLEFNMYGIPLTGFPICGFRGKANDSELCLRWYQLSAFQPLMIAHRGFGESLTDPISLSNKDEKTMEAIKSTIIIRYTLLPYLYTQFYRAHVFGEPVVRPLFYEFPEDIKTYRIDRQYLWGSALMISPVTNVSVKSVSAYFPEGNWYDYYSGRRVLFSSKGDNIELSAIEYHVNLHIRGGFVIPTQTAGKNTKESRQKPFTLIAALNSRHESSGELFIDDGISNDTTDAVKKYLLSRFTVTLDNISIETDINDLEKYDLDFYGISTTVDKIKIYGIIESPLLQTVTLSASNSEPKRVNTSQISYDNFFGVLTFKKLNINLFTTANYTLQWKYQKWDKNL